MIKDNIGDFITFIVDEFVTNLQSHTFSQDPMQKQKTLN